MTITYAVASRPGGSDLGPWVRHPRLGLAAAVLAVALMAFSLLIGVPGGAAAQGRDPAYAEFYETLDPHGDWIEHPRYGQTWVPDANDDRNWRPYSRGQWVYTEEHGWYWESDEAWGWVTYHYGRWLLDQGHGWMWVPGREWAPAWVAWREGEDAIGWAPLPPEAEFQAHEGSFSTFDSYDSPRFAPMWMFVAPAMMTMAGVHRYFHPPMRNSMYFGRTRFVTHYSYRGSHIYNRGIDRRFVERHARRPVPVLQVQPLRRPHDVGRGRNDGGPRHVGVYRPNILPMPHRGQAWPQTGPGHDRGGPRSDTGRPAVLPDARNREHQRRLPETLPQQPPVVNAPHQPDGRGREQPRRFQDTPPYQPPVVTAPHQPDGRSREHQRRLPETRPPHQPPVVNAPPPRQPSNPPPFFGGRPPAPPAAAPPPPPPPRPQVNVPPPAPPPVAKRPPPPPGPPSMNDTGRQLR